MRLGVAFFCLFVFWVHKSVDWLIGSLHKKSLEIFLISECYLELVLD